MEAYLIAFITVTLIGIANTVYLTYCCIAGKEVLCLFLPKQMCSSVQNSKYSKTFGIPNPYLGLGMLTGILVLTLLFQWQIIPFWIIFAVVAGGFLFSLYFLYIQAYVIKAYCTWCVLSALVFTALIILAIFIHMA